MTSSCFRSTTRRSLSSQTAQRLVCPQFINGTAKDSILTSHCTSGSGTRMRSLLISMENRISSCPAAPRSPSSSSGIKALRSLSPMVTSPTWRTYWL
uniref:Alternative protein LGI2 n=1 Tax=Homo sapiens TaxID=9606 RepID=L0R890_HUMAN|nr:alternative protein LGI2 [Homo sapiens]